MGRKVHPIGFRVGVIRDWQAKWYADKSYVQFLQEDLKLREAIREKYNYCWCDNPNHTTSHWM